MEDWYEKQNSDVQKKKKKKKVELVFEIVKKTIFKNNNNKNIFLWIRTIIVTLFVHFVYWDIQLTKMNK